MKVSFLNPHTMIDNIFNFRENVSIKAVWLCKVDKYPTKSNSQIDSILDFFLLLLSEPPELGTMVHISQPIHGTKPLR